ncbi:hypothetical protein [Calothrix rhizosoleniae]|nr:hypothetical protein [Calothrix rhizosoleniae]
MTIDISRFLALEGHLNFYVIYSNKIYELQMKLVKMFTSCSRIILCCDRL